MQRSWKLALVPVVALALFGAAPTFPAQSPERPRVFLDTAYSAPAGRQTSVAAGGDLQGALNAAQPGDTIILQAGRHLHRQLHSAGEERQRLDLRAELRAVEPARGGHPRGPGAGERHAEDREPQHLAGDQHRGRGSPLPVRRSRDHDDVGVHERHQLRPGLAGGAGRQHLARPGADRSGVRSLLHPRHPHRQRPAGDRDEQRADGGRGLVPVRSARGRRRQARTLASWNGPGPFKIVNNYLEGAGENVLFGGVDPAIPNLVPSDIEIRRTTCSSLARGRPAARATPASAGSVKNLFELKNAQRILIDGNLLENNWADAQNGYGVLFTVRNQDGTAPWSTVRDVTFTNNILRHSGGGA